MYRTRFSILFFLIILLAQFVVQTKCSYAANYTPELVSPASGADDISPDVAVCHWSVVDNPQSFTIEFATDNAFSDTSILFSYSVTESPYTCSGLPGLMDVYWRVIATQAGTKYYSEIFYFTTLEDNDDEGFGLDTILKDDFSTNNTAVWTLVSSSTSYLAYTTLYGNNGNGCWNANFWSYSSFTSYIWATVTIPAKGASISFDWSHYYHPTYPNDSFYFDYSTDNGSNWTQVWGLTTTAYESGQTSSGAPGPWVTTVLDLPNATKGRTIRIRFRFVSNYGPDGFLDNVHLFSYNYERTLSVSSDYGNCDPAESIVKETGDWVTASCQQFAYVTGVEDRRYRCVGWAGTGSVPLTGSLLFCTFRIYRTSNITWLWATEYRVQISSTNDYGNPVPSGDAYFMSGMSATFSADEVYNTGSTTERYALLKWTGTGSCSGTGTESSVTFTITSVSTLIWVYKLQYSLTIISPHASEDYLPELGVVWSDVNGIVSATCPDFVDLGNGIGVSYAGYTASSDVTPGQIRPIMITVSEPMTFTWLWNPAYKLNISTEHGEIYGTQSGWYLAGTSIASSFDATVNSDTDSTVRWACQGWSGTGSSGTSGIDNSVNFTLNSATTIQVLWEKQYYCAFSSNVGTTSPPSGWFAEGASFTLTAIPPATTAYTRYFFSSWMGVGSGSYTGNEVSGTVIINTAIEGQADWAIEHKLNVHTLNGSLEEDPTGWYPQGVTVTINAVSPPDGVGYRWRPGWAGEGSGSVNITRHNDSPSSVVVTMYESIEQQVAWYAQYSLTITNPSGYGFCNPVPGTYWFFEGEQAYGFCKSADADKVCVGYTATGSFGSSEMSYFAQTMSEITTLEWNWAERADYVSPKWGTSSFVNNESATSVAMVTLSDGTLVVYSSTYDGRIIRSAVVNNIWVDTELLSNLGDVFELSATVANNNIVHFTFFSSSNSSLVHGYDNFGGTSKTDCNVQIEALDVPGRRSSSYAYGDDLWISYFDISTASLRVMMYDGNSWTSYVVDEDSGAGFFSDIAVQPHNGMPIVVYQKNSGTKPLCFASFDGISWTTEEIISEFSGYFCDMALDNGGVPYIAYQSMDTPDNCSLHCVFYNGEVWEDEIADDEGVAGTDNSIIVDDEGYIHIAYHNANSLKYAVREMHGWELHTILSNTTVGDLALQLIGFTPALVFIMDSKVAYVDGTGQRTAGSGDILGDTGSDSSGGGGGCFVATAAFGSLVNTTVSSLTSIRDNAFEASGSGAGLISSYYSVSPEVANSIRNSNALRALLREMLD